MSSFVACQFEKEYKHYQPFIQEIVLVDVRFMEKTPLVFSDLDYFALFFVVDLFDLVLDVLKEIHDSCA